MSLSSLSSAVVEVVVIVVVVVVLVVLLLLLLDREVLPEVNAIHETWQPNTAESAHVATSTSNPFSVIFRGMALIL